MAAPIRLVTKARVRLAHGLAHERRSAASGRWAEKEKTPDLRGLSDAAEWSRTITGVSTHKALKLKTGRLVEPNSRSRAKSSPVVSDCFR